MTLHDYTGVIHLHSVYSYDGRTPIAEILSAARARKVAFLLLTDHSTMQARDDGFEGWNDGVLLIAGEEIAPRFNHYLAFNHKKALDCAEKEPDLPPQAYIDRVNARGGFGFIAHPDHKGAPLFHVKHYPWLAWSATGYTGIGIWDFMTDWQNSLTGYLRTLASYAFPAFFLRGPCPETLQRLDALARSRHVVGIGELDNHDTPQRLWGKTFSVFPFRRVFHLIHTHLLLEAPWSGETREDIAAVFTALRKGRCYVSLDYFRNASGFFMTLRDQHQEAFIGDHFVLNESAVFEIAAPYAARIKLLRDGKILHESFGRRLTVTINDPGVYRVEASIKCFGRWRPWIFTNHIYVEGAKDVLHRRLDNNPA